MRTKTMEKLQVILRNLSYGLGSLKVMKQENYIEV